MSRILMSAAALGASMLALPAAAAQSQPFLGQLMATAGTYCPANWTEANGQLLAVSQYDALFSLLGTTYGGDGRTTFAVPDLRGRMAGGQGSGPGLVPRPQGSRYGAPTHTMTINEMPTHNHSFNASSASPSQHTIGGGTFGTFPGSQSAYAQASNMSQVMNAGNVGMTGGNQSFSIQQPYTVTRWCIALYGIYPSRS